MTYSIVAKCPDSDRIGVAVQSHYPASAAITSWVRSSVGAVATQARGNMMYGAQGLDLLAAGTSPVDALSQLMNDDPHPEWRQVGIVGVSGAVAAHTGEACVAYAEHASADGALFLANMMRDPGVAHAMKRAWHDTSGQPLELRLMAGLEAAQEAGGDIRGQKSAGIKVCDPVADDHWWEGVSIDLRVDDHPEALRELSRLVYVRQAYRLVEAARERAARNEFDEADEIFKKACDVLPQSSEIAFWNGVMLANAGHTERAKQALRVAYDSNPDWRQLLRRVQGSELFVDDACTDDLATA